MTDTQHSKSVYILGISCFYHDSAACLIENGIIRYACQEERFTRIKHDPSFPKKSIEFILEDADISMSEITHIIFYDKPMMTFHRLIKTFLLNIPFGITLFIESMRVWVFKKIFIKRIINKELNKINNSNTSFKLFFSSHHHSHAASAFFLSPYSEATVICMDGVGEWITTSIWRGRESKLELIKSINFPHSLGLVYSAFTSYCGFKVNSGEYKLMGLAPFGKPVYKDLILKELINVYDDGSFEINMNYFSFDIDSKMTNQKFNNLFGRQPRERESEIDVFYINIASSIQSATETIVQNLVNESKKLFNSENLCMAGGVALNCVSNGKLLKNKTYKNIWIQPASGDAGGSIGAAYIVWHQFLKRDRSLLNQNNDLMYGSFLGPQYTKSQIFSSLAGTNCVYTELNDAILLEKVAKLISEENVIGWHSGKMEFGPRSLGARSILGDPRSAKAQSEINLKIKYRESFRPFAPAVLKEDVSEWFELESSSDYMLMVANVRKDKLISPNEELEGLDKINDVRSLIPAVTHVDNSARIQTVDKNTNPRFYNLINEFKKITNVPILINTSFNVRGEPIVNTPLESYMCFMKTNMDYLVIEGLLFEKSKQPMFHNHLDWTELYELD
jgi:carbamoyltransferase